MFAAWPNINHVVLTGGEPLWKNPGLVDLITWLIVDHNMTVEIETSGTVAEDDFINLLSTSVDINLYLTISPKAANANSLEYADLAAGLIEHAWQIKFLVGDEIDTNNASPIFWDKYSQEDVAQDPVYQARTYLQPMAFAKPDISVPSKIEERVNLTIKYAMETGMMISIPMPKSLGIK